MRKPTLKIASVLKVSGILNLLVFLAACGGTNPAPSTPSTPPAPPSQPGTQPPHVSFAQVQNQLLKPDCVSCHSGPSPSFGLDFTTYQNVAHNPVLPTLVVAGQPNQSALFTEIQGGVAPGGVPVTQDQVDLVFNWIQQGAPEN